VELLERDIALASLNEYADDARRGDPRLVFVAGEAGAGKTALLEALRESRAADRWLWGACAGGFTPLPLGPVLDVARQVGGPLADACESDAGRDRVFRAVLDQLDTSHPLTVFVIEDAHWADEATLDLLRFLGPRLGQAHVLVVVSYRDDGLPSDHPLRHAIGELGTHRASRRIGLAPLSHSTVDRLARRAGLPGDELFTLTAGNPFLVTEVLANGSTDVPDNARAAVLARVAPLSTGARQVIDAAAVIGGRIEVAVLEAVAEPTAETVDECLTAGALISDGDVFRFRHDIARLAVEEAIPAHRRVELHRRTLAALRASGGDDARLAHHAEGAGDAAAVVEYAVHAGRAATEMSSHREAVAQFARALRFAGTADARIRAEICDALAESESMLDRWEDSEAHRLEAIALWRSIGDPLRLGDSLRLLSKAEWRLCKAGADVAAANEALAVLEPLGPTIELARALQNMSSTLLMQGKLDDAVPGFERVVALAEQFGDKGLMARAMNALGLVKESRGADGASDVEQALAVALAAGADAEAGQIYTNIAELHANARRIHEATRWCDDGLTFSEERDMGVYVWCIEGTRSWLHDMSGRWDEAEEVCRRVIERPASSPVNLLLPHSIVARIRMRRGDPTYTEHLDAVATTIQGSEHAYPFSAIDLCNIRAEAAWLAGRPEDGREYTRSAIGIVEDNDPWLRGEAVTLARRLGDEGFDIGKVADPYQRSLDGDFLGAARMWSDLGCPYDEALVLIDANEEDTLRDAIAILDRLGAKATLAVAQQSLRALGVRSIPRGTRAASKQNRWGLTAREHEVLEHIRTGRTNPEIAEALVLSARTVDHHVSRVLAKMNVGSRQEAARLAEDAAQLASAQ
jgi:DNA-binding CsgD family transcriptional regulator/tetratricopeptide (TPR) repeat protein